MSALNGLSSVTRVIAAGLVVRMFVNGLMGVPSGELILMPLRSKLPSVLDLPRLASL